MKTDRLGIPEGLEMPIGFTNAATLADLRQDSIRRAEVLKLRRTPVVFVLVVAPYVVTLFFYAAQAVDLCDVHHGLHGTM